MFKIQEASTSSLSQSFVEATERGNYAYYLTKEDILNIARVAYFKKYAISDSRKFKISKTAIDFDKTIRDFKDSQQLARLTLITQFTSGHWGTLVLFRQFLSSQPELEAFFISTSFSPLPTSYASSLRRFGIEIYDWSDKDLNSVQRSELISYDVGLQALNYALEFNEVLDNYDDVARAISELNSRLSIPPRPSYYISLRNTLKEMLCSEACLRQLQSEQDSELELPRSKHLKVVNKISADDRLKHFTQFFIDMMQKKIAACHVLARGEPLTVDSLKQELKVCCIGMSVGLCVSLGEIKSILPTLIPVIRNNAGHFTVKNKAQKITRAFASRDFLALNPILFDSAVELFVSYEAQFTQITDKGGDVLAIEKIAEDAISRLFNYIQAEENFSDISVELITKGVVLGVSERYFMPSIRGGFIKFGLPLQDYYGNDIFTASLLENVGLSITKDGIERLYDKIIPGYRQQYGYRLALNWEERSQGGLIDIYSNKYKQVIEPPLLPYTQPGLQRDLQNYRYSLGSLLTQAKKEELFFKFISRKPSEIASKAKTPIIFDLRHPIENFTGRSQVLLTLHDTLLTNKDRRSAIVNTMSRLSLGNEDSASISGNSGTQVSLSGLGGVGKTQLALRYASLYAESYDNNVIWINCDTEATLSHSFLRLAGKLEIKIKDDYGENKAIETVVEEVYEYFAEQRSLFILDNVENFREIELFLPKVMVGNKPYVLITSRYQNWENIAPTVQLSVFSEEETKSLLKRALKINNSQQDKSIKELHYLLEGLPLALQQAIAYIKVQKIKIENYVDRYKEESRKLLNFNFRDYTNDPYLKTTYTTWQVTLRKIQEVPEVGKVAVEILESMSFLASEELYEETFTALYGNIDTLRLALALLRSYSMTSEGEVLSEHNIHRMVQKVIILSLQNDPRVFIQSVQRTHKLLIKYQTDLNICYHYLFFLLNVIEYPELEVHLGIKYSINNFALLLMKYEDGILWNNLFDRIYHRFTKPKYIDFLTVTYLTYRKQYSTSFLKIFFGYLERKYNEGLLDKSEIFQIVDDLTVLDGRPEYIISRVFSDPVKRRLQIETVKLIFEFKKSFLAEYMFGNSSASCLPKRKRSLYCLIESGIQRNDRQQRLVRHLDQLMRISGFLSTGLFTKDMIVDLMQGDFKPVAINTGLLLGGRILGGLSGVMRGQGEKLITESSLLNELAFETKALPSLSKEVVALTKKRLLGGVLKTAAPFVKRCTTVYFAYNLYQDIAAYETGDSEQLSGIVSNAGIISIDLIEMGIEGAEALELISGVSAVTGPISETLLALIWLSVESYEVNERLSIIEQLTVLTESEKILQGLRLFVGKGFFPDLEVRIKNNHLVQQGIAFLKTHTGFKRFVFSDAEESSVQEETKKVDLSKLHTLALASSAPDDLSEGWLICASGVVNPLFGSRIKNNFYACEKAIGIEYPTNRTGDGTLITLGKGNDEVNVKWNTPSVFVVEEGYKLYQGSDQNDRFVIKGDSVWGKLNGKRGFDTINLENYSPSNNWTLLDWRGYLCNVEVTRPECNFEYAPSNDIIFIDKIHSLCKTYSTVPECDLAYGSRLVKLESVDYIQGRKNKKDIFFLVEDRVAVDGRSGDKINPDTIYVTNRMWSDRKPQIVLRTNTVVRYRQYLKPRLPFYPVHYLVPLDQQPGDTQVVFPFNSSLIQYFYFEFPLKNLANIIIKNRHIQFDFSIPPLFKFQPKLFSLILQDGPVSIAPTLRNKHSIRPMKPKLDSIASNSSLPIPENVYYVFKEGIELKLLDEKHIYAKIEQGGSIEEHLNNFIVVANQIGKSFSIQFANNQTASIGSEQDEVLTTDCLSESYLVGNGGGNIYVLSPLNTSSFFLPEVTLYDLSAETTYENLRDTLDLRKVINKARSICPLQTLSTSLFPTGKDLVLQLTTDSLFDNACQRLNTSWPIASIRLKKAFFNKWYQKLDVVYDDHREMDIFYTREKGWFLVDKAFVFEVDKEIIVLTDQEFYPHAEFILLKNIGNITFFNHNQTDLILTNAQDLNHFNYGLYTILISQFYSLEEVYEKALTATFTFLDDTLILKNYTSQITQAANVLDLSIQYHSLTSAHLGKQTKGSPVGHYQKENLAVESITAKLTEQRTAEKSTSNSLLSIAKAAISAITVFSLTMVMGLSYLFVRRFRHSTIPEVSKNIVVSIPLMSQLPTGTGKPISVDTKSSIMAEELVKTTAANNNRNELYESAILEQGFAGLCQSWGSVASFLAMEFKKRREERISRLDLHRKVALKHIEHLQAKHKLQELVNSFIVCIDEKLKKTTQVNSTKLVYWIVCHLMDEDYSKYLMGSVSQAELLNKVEIWLNTFIASQNEQFVQDQKGFLAGAVNSFSFSEFISHLFIDKVCQLYQDRPFSEIEELAEKQKLALIKIIPVILQEEEKLVSSLSVAKGTDFIALAKNGRDDKQIPELTSKAKQPMKQKYLPNLFNYFKPANLTEMSKTISFKQAMW